MLWIGSLSSLSPSDDGLHIAKPHELFGTIYVLDVGWSRVTVRVEGQAEPQVDTCHPLNSHNPNAQTPRAPTAPNFWQVGFVRLRHPKRSLAPQTALQIPLSKPLSMICMFKHLSAHKQSLHVFEHSRTLPFKIEYKSTPSCTSSRSEAWTLAELGKPLPRLVEFDWGGGGGVGGGGGGLGHF